MLLFCRGRSKLETTSLFTKSTGIDPRGGEVKENSAPTTSASALCQQHEIYGSSIERNTKK
jgi:hypothetical protein